MALNVLVVGTGMYVCGRGTDGYGTVLPSLYESFREGLIKEIAVVGTRSTSAKRLDVAIQGLNKVMGLNPVVNVYPRKGVNPSAYKKIASKMKPDCAIVVTPDHLHYKITKDLMAQRIHCLVVKPLAVNLTQASKMVSLAKEKNVYGAVEFHKRFDDSNRKIKEIIKTGRIGDILNVAVEYSQRKIIPSQIFKGWAEKTTIFQYLGVHYVDIIYFVTGARPIRVLAAGQKRWLINKGINTYDAMQVMIEWQDPETKNKFISTILTNWIDPNETSAMSDQKIRFFGTRGRIEADQKNRGLQVVTDEKGIEDNNPYFCQFYLKDDNKYELKGYGKESICQFVKDVQQIKKKKKNLSEFAASRPTFEQALISSAVIDATHRSLKNKNQWEKIVNR